MMNFLLTGCVVKRESGDDHGKTINHSTLLYYNSTVTLL